MCIRKRLLLFYAFNLSKNFCYCIFYFSFKPFCFNFPHSTTMAAISVWRTYGLILETEKCFLLYHSGSQEVAVGSAFVYFFLNALKRLRQSWNKDCFCWKEMVLYVEILLPWQHLTSCMKTRNGHGELFVWITSRNISYLVVVPH